MALSRQQLPIDRPLEQYGGYFALYKVEENIIHSGVGLVYDPSFNLISSQLDDKLSPSCIKTIFLNNKERHMFMSSEIKATFLIVRTACPYFQNGHFCDNKL